MLNICLDTLIFGKQRIGGISNVWYEYLSRMLEDKNCNVTLLDIDNYINNSFNTLDLSKANHIKEKSNNIQYLRLQQPDLKSYNEKTIFQSTFLRTSKKKNVKNVIIIHDCTHQIYIKGVQKWINTYQKRKAIKNADGIICISESTKNDVLKFFPKSRNKRIQVINIAASDEYKILNDKELPQRYNILEGKKYIIYVGERFPYKNLKFMYEVLRNQKDLCGVLIGGPEFSEKEDISDIKDRLYRFTKVPNDELNILYNNALCMLYSSLYEGFGIPLLESMKAGCPVIAFNNSSIPEVMRGSGILLENNDLKNCIEKIELLKKDEIYRKNIVLKQLEESKFFSWDKSYKNLIDFYNEIYNA